MSAACSLFIIEGELHPWWGMVPSKVYFVKDKLYQSHQHFFSEHSATLKPTKKPDKFFQPKAQIDLHFPENRVPPNPLVTHHFHSFSPYVPSSNGPLGVFNFAIFPWVAGHVWTFCTLEGGGPFGTRSSMASSKSEAASG